MLLRIMDDLSRMEGGISKPSLDTWAYTFPFYSYIDIYHSGIHC